MPVYEYKCKRCAQVFEKLLNRDQRDNHGPCPACNCARSQRLMSMFAGHSSGGGAIGGSSSCGGCAKGSCAGCGH
jgi:putative FmdB family regulatory protein